MTEPTTLSRDDLETLYLVRLMQIDSQVWRDRMQGAESLSMRPHPRKIGPIVIRRLAEKAGCPKGVSASSWLREHGLIAKLDADHFVITKKSMELRGAEHAMS